MLAATDERPWSKLRRWAGRLCALLAALLGVGACTAAPPVPASAAKAAMAPWLVVDADAGYRMEEYGYRDVADGQVLIDRQYADAQPFRDGYAVVARLDPPRTLKYGVIDKQNQVVIPLQYDYVELVHQGGLTLAFLKQQYNAWWRFWEWTSPSLFGPNHITRVLRDRWTAMTLPGKQVLLKERLPYTRGYGFGYHHRVSSAMTPQGQDIVPFRLDVTSVAGLVRLENKVYRYDDEGRLHQLTDQFVAFTRAGHLLVREGDHWRLLDADGKPLDARRFSRAPVAHVTGPGGETLKVLPTYSSASQYWWRQFEPDGLLSRPNLFTAELLFTTDLRHRFPFLRQRPFYQDQQGRYYLAPDFQTPLPASITDYQGKGGRFSAREILDHLALVVALPGKGGFLLATTDRFREPGRTFFLDASGAWKADMPALNGPVKLFAGNRILFMGEGTRGVLMADDGFNTGVFHALPLSIASPCAGQPGWYLGRDLKTRKYGVYDALRQRWQVPPTYDYLLEELVPGVGVYRMNLVEQRGSVELPISRYGLLDLAHNQRITPPLYVFVDSDGRVGREQNFVNGYGVSVDEGLSFYLNPMTGAEYRRRVPEHREVLPSPCAERSRVAGSATHRCWILRLRAE